jgi:hypothetical protein
MAKPLKPAVLIALFDLPIRQRLALSERWQPRVEATCRARSASQVLATGPLQDLWPLHRALWHLRQGRRTKAPGPIRENHLYDAQGEVCGVELLLRGNHDPALTTRLRHGDQVELAHTSAGGGPEWYVLRLTLQGGRPIRGEAVAREPGREKDLIEAGWTFRWKGEQLLELQIQPRKRTERRFSALVDPLTAWVNGRAVEVHRPGVREPERLVLR